MGLLESANALCIILVGTGDKNSGVHHRAGNVPAFLFTYGEKRRFETVYRRIRGSGRFFTAQPNLFHRFRRFGNFWLTQEQIVSLYHSGKSNISEHIKHILEEGELTLEATVRKFRTAQKEGEREAGRNIAYIHPESQGRID